MLQLFRQVSMFRQTYILLVSILICCTIFASLISSPQVTHAASNNCNLAPNAGFEKGTSTTINQWAFGQFSGSGSFTLANAYQSLTPWPPTGVQYKAVQSGGRAAKVTVTTPGNMYLTTFPEGVQGIPVSPNTQYVFSVRMRSDANTFARVGIVQSGSTGLDVGQVYSAPKSGNGDWTTVELTFTTNSSARYVSLRLNHNNTNGASTWNAAGTFYWDDPLFYKAVSGQRCVDLRHYIMQSTPGFVMCNSFTPVGCNDGYKASNGEFIYAIAENSQPVASDHWSNNGTTGSVIGIHKMFDYRGWQCVANVGSTCNASSNASSSIQNMDFMQTLPRLSGASILSSNNRTTNAKMINDWQSFDLRPFDSTTGVDFGPAVQYRERRWAFVADSINFGGSIGLRENVLVFEEEHIWTSGTLPPGINGQYMERYFYVQGYGRVGMFWGTDVDCQPSNPANCNGENYRGDNLNGTYAPTMHGMIFGIEVTGDFLVPPVNPSKNKLDWW